MLVWMFIVSRIFGVFVSDEIVFDKIGKLIKERLKNGIIFFRSY